MIILPSGKLKLLAVSPLANAPFVKVEATKFTEVGYVGRDVESAVRELADAESAWLKKRKWRKLPNKQRS